MREQVRPSSQQCAENSIGPGGSDSKESDSSAGDQVPWVGKIPWRRESPPTPVSLPGESHGQRSLVGYSLWDLKESDTTEQLTLSYMRIYILTMQLLSEALPQIIYHWRSREFDTHCANEKACAQKTD